MINATGMNKTVTLAVNTTNQVILVQNLLAVNVAVAKNKVTRTALIRWGG